MQIIKCETYNTCEKLILCYEEGAYAVFNYPIKNIKHITLTYLTPTDEGFDTNNSEYFHINDIESAEKAFNTRCKFVDPINRTKLGKTIDEIYTIENERLKEHLKIVRETCKACWNKETGMHGSTIDYFLKICYNIFMNTSIQDIIKTPSGNILQYAGYINMSTLTCLDGWHPYKLNVSSSIQKSIYHDKLISPEFDTNTSLSWYMHIWIQTKKFNKIGLSEKQFDKYKSLLQNIGK